MARGSKFALTEEHYELKSRIEKREQELKDLLREQEEYVKMCQDGWSPRGASQSKGSHEANDDERPKLVKKIVKVGSMEEVQLDLSFVKA